MVEHDLYEFTHAPRFNRMVERLELQEASNAKILEVGMEPYVFTERLLNAHPDIRLFGINYGEADPSEVTVSGQEVTVKHCNIEEGEWPYGDEEFDIVIMGAILEHLFDPVSALLEARRVIRHTGRIVISTPNAVNIGTRLTTFFGKNPFDGFSLESKYNRHQHEYTREELDDLLRTCGLVPEYLETVVERRKNLVPNIVQQISRLHPNLQDQLIATCHREKPINRLPIVYRQGLTEMEEEHPKLREYQR